MTAANDQYGRCTNSTVPVLAVVPTVLVCSTARTNSTFVPVVEDANARALPLRTGMHSSLGGCAHPPARVHTSVETILTVLFWSVRLGSR